MPKITYITPQFAVAGQLAPEDFAQLAAMGIKSVIGNRPDDEPGVLVDSEQAKTLAERAGLNFRYAPTTNHAVVEPASVDAFEEALSGLPGPVLAYCRSGTRSSILWVQLAARYGSTEAALWALGEAGFDLSFLKPDLDEISGAYHAGTKVRELASEAA